MHIIEKFTQSKTGNDSLNEDVIVETTDFVGVLDGATSFTGLKINGMPNGRFASTSVAKIIESLDAQATAHEAIRYISQKFNKVSQAAHQDAGLLLTTPDTYPASALLLYSKARKEVWRLADSPFMADGVVNEYNIPTIGVLTEMRKVVVHAALKSGVSVQALIENDPMTETWKKLIPPLQVFINGSASPYSFGMITGKEVPQELIQIYPVDGVKELVLASDGYMKLFNSLAETEAKHRQILTDDPLLIGEYAQIKTIKKGGVSFDDRTYIRLELS